MDRADGFACSVSRLWNTTYAPDWVGVALLATAYILIQFFVEPFHRMFSLDDLRISFPHAEVERVPLALDIAYAFVLPLFLVLLINRLAGASAHKHHVSVLGLAIALALTALLTDLAKNAAGRPRPDLLARCKPAPGTPRPALVTVAACTETRPQLLHDGWRSFPSGHSSFAFAGLGHLALFLAGQLRVFSHGAAAADAADERAEKLVRGDLLRALACLLPLLGAAAVAFSRVEDYRHDVYDVCAGALLGWTVTYWSYRRYWPRLGSARADEPFAGPRAKEARRAGAYGRVRDVEEGANVGIALRDLH